MDQKPLIITIAREFGSGGRIIGKKLAQKLGIHYYDEEILTMTSEVSAVGEQYFRLADEKAGNSLLHKIIGGTGLVHEKPKTKGERITSPDNLFRFLSSVIRQLAEEESCIFIGRCADYILEDRDRDNVIHLFIHADENSNLERTMEVVGIDRQEAARRVSRINKEREDYYRYFSGRDWEDLSYYDLTINTTRISRDQAVELVEQYIHMRGFN